MKITENASDNLLKILLNILSFPPALLRYSGHIILSKFKVYTVMILNMYILQNAYHSKIS